MCIVTSPEGAVLSGAKSFASGSGRIDRAVVTARDATGARRMLVVRANDPARADAAGWTVRGMKATLSGLYDLSGLPASEESLLGAAGDYEREPRFSAGAWRFTAVQLGGVERIVEVKFTPEEKAAFDKSVGAVRDLIEAFKKLGV